MKTRHLLMAAITGMTALCACNEEESFSGIEDTRLQVSASLASTVRSVIEGTELPEAAQIGVSLFDQSGADYDGKQAGYKNIPYTKGAGWTSKTPIILSPTVGKAVAYYPYSAEVNDITAINVETASQTDYLYSDWAENISAKNTKAAFSMNHALCAVQINLVNDSYEVGDGVVSRLAVSAAELAATAKLNAMTGALTDFGNKNTKISIDKTFTLSKDVQTSRIIAVPTGAKADITVEVTIDGKAASLLVPMSKPFEQGKSYVIDLKVKDTQNPLELVSVTVIPWNEETLGDVDVYNDNSYIIQVEMPSAGSSFQTNVHNFTGIIDWGDGTEPVSYTDANNPSHYYAKAGTYTITHKGTATRLSFFTNSTTPQPINFGHYLTNILYIGKELGITSMSFAFYGCSKLTNIKPEIFDNCTNVTDFSYTFYGCSRIAAIPQGLFDKCTQVTDFREAFNNCRALTSIPAGLFDKCTQVKDFSDTFSDCSALTSIPTGLFDNCPNVTDFVRTFSYCKSLISIPAGLFDKCTLVTTFWGTFGGTCVTSIPAGLFDKCTQVTNFENTFEWCQKLTTIPAGLFDNCPLVTNFWGTFRGCYSLTEIPQGLFDKCTQVTNFERTFRECSALTSIPTGLFDKCTQVTNFSNTFSGCLALTSIPTGLFDKCTQVTNLSNTFNGCSKLTTIPEGLFDNCTLVKNFLGTFSGCLALTSIPTGLFDKCTQVTGFERTFRECSALTSIPTGLFDKCTQVTDFREAFNGCSALTSIPAGLFDKCTLVTDFKATFSECRTLTSIPTGLFNNCTLVTNFSFTFSSCSKLTGESPYTMIGDKKVHLYERKNHPKHFTAPTYHSGCFSSCDNLSDKSSIPSDWK